MKNTLETARGTPLVRKALEADIPAMLEVVRDAARWLEARGSSQWSRMLGPFGLELVARRVRGGHAFLTEAGGRAVATVTAPFEDVFGWGEKGKDGTAGYVNGLAVTREYSGARMGRDLLMWAVHYIGESRPMARTDCMAGNPGLKHFYEEAGFVFVEPCVLEGHFPALRFERPAR